MLLPTNVQLLLCHLFMRQSSLYQVACHLYQRSSGGKAIISSLTEWHLPVIPDIWEAEEGR